MMRLLFVFFIALNFSALSAQQQQFFKLKKYRIAQLPDTIRENSGLAFFQNRLFTINDSGNTSEIFEIDRKNGTVQNIYATSLENKDWEAIAADSLHLYIADFGNNLGNRKDLVIYRIPMHGQPAADSVQQIPYYYPEQKDFSRKNLNNDFDAEAMVFLNGKLHIFTKEWSSRATTHYVVDPQIKERQAAQKVETYQTDYVVTDAAYYRGKLYLVGYTKKTEVYLTVFNETEPGIFFSAAPAKFYLGSSLALSQIEGIEVNDEGIYISGEKFTSPLGTVKPALYFIPHAKLK